MKRAVASIAAPFRDGRSARRHLMDAELETLAPLMRGRVLEVGNGRRGRRGTFRPPVAGADAWFYVDREVSAAPHVSGDAVLLPFASGVFDTVVCLEVLEYVDAPDRAFREIARVLRPRGSAIVSTPYNTSPDTTHDFWRFTAHGLRRLAGTAGLEVTHLSAQGSQASVILHMMRALNGGSAWRRRIVSWTTTPAFQLVLALDRQRPSVSADGGYTTGFVLVARKPDGAAAAVAH